MNRAHRALVTVTSALAVCAAAAAAIAAAEQLDRSGLRDRLDDVVAAGAVGALAEVRDEQGGWRGTAGVAEVGNTRPVPVEGRFRVGSITKTFVSTVVLQLVEEGRLKLDDPVEVWLPAVVPGGGQITLRHLLSNTSGLHDFVKTLPMPPSQDFMDNRWRTWTGDELLARALSHPPTFTPPGSSYEYSNTNYVLLGKIIEKVTGRSYADEIDRRLVGPLGLRDTSLPGTSPQIPEPHPHGYVPTQHDGEMRLLDYTEMNPSVFGVGGEMISTTEDLNRFFAALLGGRLLPGHLLDDMKTMGVAGSTYGLGLRKRDTPCGIRAYGNDGDAVAYQAWSFSTEDGRRQVTLALTPDFRGDPDDAVDAFLNKAVCG